MNRQIKPWHRLGLLKRENFDCTLTVRNVSKLVCKEDHLLNKPPNSMLSINFIP